MMRGNTKRRVTVPRPAAVVALAALAGLFASAPAAAQRRVERGVPAAADATIRIYNLTGSTTITGWDRDSVALVGTLDAGAGRLYMGGSRAAIKLGVENPHEMTGATAASPGPAGSARLEVREAALRKIVDAAVARRPGASAQIEIVKQYRNMADGLSRRPEVMARAL